MMDNVIKIPAIGQQIIAIGTRGSGKSELMICLLQLAHSKRKFVIDTQNGLGKDLPDYKLIKTPQALAWKMKMWKKIRYVPNNEYRNRTAWEYIFNTIANSSSKSKPKPIDLYIDELMHIGYGMSFPTSLPILCSTARQKKIGVWIATQRPTMIPIPILTEATTIFVFYLKYLEDLKKIGKFSRLGGLSTDLREMQLNHQFIELNGLTGSYRIMPRLNLEAVKERIEAERS
jgi:energy-coupling factor transporter ATP-binding protein EcfA2